MLLSSIGLSRLSRSVHRVSANHRIPLCPGKECHRTRFVRRIVLSCGAGGIPPKSPPRVPFLGAPMLFMPWTPGIVHITSPEAKAGVMISVCDSLFTFDRQLENLLRGVQQLHGHGFNRGLVQPPSPNAAHSGKGIHHVPQRWTDEGNHPLFFATGCKRPYQELFLGQ